jgi:hypothetical protein
MAKRPVKTSRPARPATPARKAARGNKPKKARAQAQRLPGLDIPKDRALDALCKSLAECYETINDANGERKGLQANALQHLRKKSYETYAAHGVRLTWIHGEERVAVKLVDSDEGGDADEPTRSAPSVANEDDAAAPVVEE